MSDFENNNLNPEGSSNHTNSNQNPNNKVPEYSFWAENITNGGSSGNAYGPSGNAYGPFGTYGPSGNQSVDSNPYPGYSQSGRGYQTYSGSGPNSYQGDGTGSYQSSGYQNAPYQNNAYQNNPYQGNGYQNSSNQNYSYANYNPNANPWDYGNSQVNTEKKKKRRERKPVNKGVKFFAKAVCFGLIAAISFAGFQQLYYVIDPESASNQLIGSLARKTVQEERYEIGYTSSGNVKLSDRSAISLIVDETMSSIVSINSTSTQTSDWFGRQYSQEVEGSGSGFVVGKNEKELLIATNNHVVEGTDTIMVTFIDGTKSNAVIKGTDVAADLAVVCVDIASLEKDTLDAISVAKLGNSDDIKVGQMSVAIGNALGYGQSVTVGYISAKDREVEVSNGYNSNKMVLLQTDAAINPGNSGGALLNLDGEVIGINTVKYASNEVEGMGYAIPISRAIPIINELMSREILAEEEQGYLGIAGNDVTEDVASYYNMPVGVFVNEVSKGGAAEKAGLLSGDIITKADDIEITSITQLRDYVTSKRVGSPVEVTYMRKTSGEYKEDKVTVTLGKNPALENSQE